MCIHLTPAKVFEEKISTLKMSFLIFKRFSYVFFCNPSYLLLSFSFCLLYHLGVSNFIYLLSSWPLAFDSIRCDCIIFKNSEEKKKTKQIRESFNLFKRCCWVNFLFLKLQRKTLRQKYMEKKKFQEKKDDETWNILSFDPL